MSIISINNDTEYFIRITCRDLYNWEEKREVAIQTFNTNKMEYMHVAAQGLEKDLKLRS